MRKLILPYFNFYENFILWIGAFLKLLLSKIPGFRRLYNIKKIIIDLQKRSFSLERKGRFFFITDSNSPKKGIYQIRTAGSDLLVFQQIFVNEEYKTVLDLNFERIEKIKTIVDLGANIGISSIYFGNSFPESKIYAVEPEPNNFEMLLRNIELNKSENIIPINAAVWNKNENLTISSEFRDKLSWSSQTIPSADSNKVSIKGVTLDSLIKKYKISKIDILKIDIEGAEEQIFNHYPLIHEILAITDIIALEIHDEIVTRALIYNILNNNFSLIEAGETTFAYRK